jgi:hypothetical protein
MSSVPKDKEREHRIIYEVVVDAYDEEERAMGWYYYVGDQIEHPFKAKCVLERDISPLRVDETVEVRGIASGDECMREVFVSIAWEGRTFSVPLSQLEPIDCDEATRQVVEDWRYWVARGYQY